MNTRGKSFKHRADIIIHNSSFDNMFRLISILEKETGCSWYCDGSGWKYIMRKGTVIFFHNFCECMNCFKNLCWGLHKVGNYSQIIHNNLVETCHYITFSHKFSCSYFKVIPLHKFSADVKLKCNESSKAMELINEAL